jgi:hypothetical protein
MPTYSYPTSAELTVIGQDFMGAMTKGPETDPIFGYFPITEVRNHLLEWEQKDNYRGLQMVRGLNGEPGRVASIGGRRYVMRPGVYGEYMPIAEDEITTRRQWGTFGTPIDLDDIVTEKTEQLVAREVARIRKMLWDLVIAGTFSVTGPTGAILHTDSYTTQTASAAVAWATVATATPLVDLRSVALLARGHSTSFGRRAVGYANQVTVNNLLKNTNAADLGGLRTMNGPYTLADLNRIFLANDLPTIEVMDDGYYDDSGTFQLYIPNSKVAIFGTRPAGQPIGEYRHTLNANNPNSAPGPYDIVYESPEPPKEVRVHRGQNGGPVIYWPSAIVVLTTS